MALPASAVTPSSSRVILFKSRLPQFQRNFALHAQNHPIYITCHINLPRMGQFPEPSKPNMYLSYFKEKLWEFTPDSVKSLPWKRAESAASHLNSHIRFAMEKLWEFRPDTIKDIPWKELEDHVMVSGREALKWSLAALCIFSFLSDVGYSISRNKELVIPFGLFVGCMITNFLKEASQELCDMKEGGKTLQLQGISCFFALVKILCVSVGAQVFLLHVANGGLIQVLWHWKNLSVQNEDKSASIMVEDSSVGMAADD